MPTATVTQTIHKDTVQNIYDRIVSELPDNTVDLLDDLGEIYKESMDNDAPYLTGFLVSMHIVEQLGTYDRYIYSEADYFDSVVGGHTVWGPIFSDTQRKWWFWYLANVLGDSYEPKVGSGNKMEGNNYPMRAYYDAQGAKDARVQDFLSKIGSG
ncbi:MAG: hypothetical protein K8E24_012100 [Methanobacterium paludis]|nr:hypothetical protein [Methanobacterium paludis]